MMITADKIKVYDSFNGLWDGLALTGSAYQKGLFEDNDDWYLLTNFYQDIVMINNKLASAGYIRSVLDKMNKCSDDEACTILRARIIL